MFNRFTPHCFFLLACIGLASHAKAEQIFIDDFTSGEGSVFLGPAEIGPATQTILGLAENQTLGGQREIFAQNNSELIDAGLAISFRQPTNGSGLVAEIFGFNSFGQAGIRWGEGGLEQPFNAREFTLRGTLEEEPPVGTDNRADVSLTLTSDNQVSETSSVSINGVFGDFEFGWNETDFSQVDLSRISQVELEFSGDFFRAQLDSFTASIVSVPEPSATVVLAILAGSFVAVRRRTT